jgi:hypothetical protein
MAKQFPLMGTIEGFGLEALAYQLFGAMKSRPSRWIY